jgi:hypothetical protein
LLSSGSLSVNDGVSSISMRESSLSE